MFTLRRIATLAVTAAAFAVPGAAHAQAPDAALEWTVDNNFDTQTVKNAREYKLSNRGSRVGYENRTFGVDLGWNSNGNWVFRRNTGSANVRDHRSYPLTETENVSIYNTKKKAYLRYKQRGVWKAELEWDSSPQFQWQLRRQTAVGDNVKFALFNDKVDKFLVHQVKNYGINLGWLEQGTPVAQTFSVPLSAQPVVQGWVPYAGSFGGGVKGKLLDVQNASQTATLLFLKPGRSTGQCGDPSATIAVPPRERLKADQLQTLYGSSTPALPVNFLACLTTPTPQSISLTFLNISYRLDG